MECGEEAMTADGSSHPFDALRRDVEEELAGHFDEADAGENQVRRAMRESVLGGGKRLRPVMTVVAAQDLGCRSHAALRAGCAVELVHTASLLLDDLPCMDDAATRRGQPAAHLRFGEDVAILASIALLSDAYAIVATLPGVPGDTATRLISTLSHAIGLKGLVAGQYKDLHRSGRRFDDATTVNDQKTGSLFLTCLEMAATLAGADNSSGEPLRAYGREIGRAFQLFDDLLDMDGDPALMGKTVGQDRAKPNIAARRLGRAATLGLIERHVAAARLSLAGLPVRAGGLHALTDHIFGIDGDVRGDDAEVRERPVMAGLLAR